MHTIYHAELPAPLVKAVVHDYPQIFGAGDSRHLEIVDWDLAISLMGEIEIQDEEGGLWLSIDGATYPLTEA